MQVWLWLFTGMKARQWAAVHRKHHRFTDIEGDPHSPKLEGLGKILLANALLYRREASNPETLERYTRDIKQNWIQRNILGRGYTGMAVGLTITILLLGVPGGLLAFVVNALLYVFLSGIINGACHVIGYRNFPNPATNLHWAGWLIAGEGYHNNHHEFPASAKFSKRRNEFDPAWPVIWLLVRLRLAKTA